MTIEEAIEHNKESKRYLYIRKYPEDAVKAIQLGIEALERERDCRSNMPREEWLLLPSEGGREMTQGLYGKYNITKADGTPIDTEAQYFILRIDTDAHARRALRAYANSLDRYGGDVELQGDIWRWLTDTSNTPAGITEVNEAAKRAGLSLPSEGEK